VLVRSPSSRFALWAAVAALVLKSAVPLLASAAAELQGKGVAQICSIYGVDLAAATATHDAPAAHHPHHHHGQAPDAEPAEHEGDHRDTTHGSDHCALAALAAGVADAAPVWQSRVGLSHAIALPERGCQAGHDACASWAARLKHGPPERA